MINITYTCMIHIFKYTCTYKYIQEYVYLKHKHFSRCFGRSNPQRLACRNSLTVYIAFEIIDVIFDPNGPFQGHVFYLYKTQTALFRATLSLQKIFSCSKWSLYLQSTLYTKPMYMKIHSVREPRCPHTHISTYLNTNEHAFQRKLHLPIHLSLIDNTITHGDTDLM